MLNALKTKRYNIKTSSNNDEKKLIQIVPEPKFVIKTKIFSSYGGSLPGTKLFINVGSHPKVPMPKDDSGNDTEVFDPAIIFPQIMNNKWEIPILTSPQLRNGKDKKGKNCLIVDCIINRKPMEWVSLNADLRMILTQWCFDSVEFQVGGHFLIDRDAVKFPRRSYMGQLQNIEVNVANLNNDFHEVQELQNSFDQKESFTNILDAKRLMQEENGLNNLKMPNDSPVFPAAKPSPLILEINPSNLHHSKQKPKEKLVSQTNEKIPFTVDLKMLEPKDTKECYTFLLHVTSQLSGDDNFELNYNKYTKSIIISSSGKINSSPIAFPIPAKSQGLITSYYLKAEKSLYIFVR
ncbi:hypothetical protein HII13_000011 [Brettanomyces bruxellensis]|nr:hypothetical protein HII13_000011 [Brettanomyces bruxellensis]